MRSNDADDGDNYVLNILEFRQKSWIILEYEPIFDAVFYHVSICDAL